MGANLPNLVARAGAIRSTLRGIRTLLVEDLRMAATEHVQARARQLVGGLVLLAVFFLVGCGEGGKGDISGKVTYNGQPIPWGRVSFASEVGNKVTTTGQIVKGNYTVSNCPAGPAKIAVESFAAPTPSAKPSPMTKDMASKMFPGGGPPEPPPPDVVGKVVKIPAKYTDPGQSGLTYTVQRGPQTHDIALTP